MNLTEVLAKYPIAEYDERFAVNAVIMSDICGTTLIRCDWSFTWHMVSPPLCEPV